MSMAFLSVSRPTFSVSFVMSGPPCLGLGAGPSGATPVIACARTAHLNPLPWTCGLSLSKDAEWFCSEEGRPQAAPTHSHIGASHPRDDGAFGVGQGVVEVDDALLGGLQLVGPGQDALVGFPVGLGGARRVA